MEWLDEATVAAKLGQEGSGSASRRSGTPAPGLHGTGLDSVSVGDTKLNPDAPNRLPAADDIVFTVAFANQGENDEFDVRVVLRIVGGPKPIRVARTVDTVARGQTAEVAIPLGQKPPTGTAVTVEAEVSKVPGEEKPTTTRASTTCLVHRVAPGSATDKSRVYRLQHLERPQAACRFISGKALTCPQRRRP